MNLLFFLTPKQDVLYIYEDFTLRQTLEKWANQRFATIPVLKRNGEYVGTITDMPSLLQAAIDQNFVPVVDDRNVFIGMVRRTVILRDVYNKYGAKLDKPRQNTYTHA